MSVEQQPAGDADAENAPRDASDRPNPQRWKKIAVLATTVAVFAGAFFLFREHLSPQKLADQEAVWQSFRDQHPVLVYGLAFLIYVTVTGLSLPGATIMTLLIGWFFGFFRAMILVSFASTTGATIAFLLSRYLLRDTVQSKFGERLAGFNRALEQEGAFYLFTLRLIPYVPFFVINVVMGLTSIRAVTYWWVSQIGMLPGTAVYVYAGDQIPSLQDLLAKDPGEILTPQLAVAFVLLGLFPISAKRLLSYFRPKPSQSNSSTVPE